MSAKESRLLTTLIQEICVERGIMCEFLTIDGYVLRLSYRGSTHIINGYDFGMDKAGAMRLARDKSLTIKLLSEANIPCVKGRLFFNPAFRSLIPDGGNWPAIKKYIHDIGFPVVVKVHDGAGGKHVYCAESETDLKNALESIFALGSTHHVLVGPYYEIRTEFRCTYLAGELVLVYKKIPSSIIGDGVSTVSELVMSHIQADPTLPAKVIRNLLHDSANDAYRILQQGEVYRLGWKFNLANGNVAEVVADPDPRIVDLVIRTADTLGLVFANIDVIETNAGEYMVMEANTVAFERFGNMHTSNRALAKGVYERAIINIFGLEA